MTSTKEIVVVYAEKNSKRYQGAFRKANWKGEKKERERRGMEIKTEKIVTMSSKDIEQLFKLKTDNFGEYMDRITVLLQETPPPEKIDKE